MFATPHGADFEKTLFLMLTSGKYYLAMSWVAGAQGRAFDKTRANAVWKSMIELTSLLYADICAIFFKNVAFNNHS